jgi:hypothetical protein
MSNYPVPVAVPAYTASPYDAHPAPSSISNTTSMVNPSPLSSPPVFNQNQEQTLLSQGYTKGLIKALESSSKAFAMRFWVIDNSGSMGMTDGHKFIETKGGQIKVISCTRWNEIQETVEYHAQMAALINAPTVFRLLNDPGSHIGPQEFGVADKGEAMISNDLQVAMQTMRNATPCGVTPLSQHIYEIKNRVEMMHSQLQGRKVAIILATDGLPSNPTGVTDIYSKNELVNALRSLEGLPVWIIIRLCTDDASVVEYYNSIDANLELSIEVLDNYTDEAKELYTKNPWLNYTLPMHRMREFGCPNRLFDMLDERQLTISELREFCIFLFGVDKFDGVPLPEVDFTGFLRSIDKMMAKEKLQWHPVKNKVLPLLNLQKLSKIYGDGSCTIM